ncbi:MAG: CotH kinase family protein, partial [Bacteroidaceae bacterium]|nr:CotH kinase family protein [Bacteroidaceae bacterium]
SHVITGVGWMSRKGQASRVQLGIFEGSNREDFLDAVPLFIIPGAGEDAKWFTAEVAVTRAFRYVRYVGPSDVRCNIAEVAFWGEEGEGKDSIFYQLTDVPTVSIHTYNGNEPMDKVTDLEANITITYNNGTLIQEYPILTRGRGNASWTFPKKPYRIKFNDDKKHHMLKDSPMESPAKAKKWTLINNHGDKTLMRNLVAFEISRRLNLPYTVYAQPVDVILNGEYKGCYQLSDQITTDKARVPITDMEPTDEQEPELTGGYLLEIDAYADAEKSKFTSKHNIPVTIKSPDEDDITQTQHNYIKSYFESMEDLLWSDNYTDPVNGYRKKLDVTSFLQYFLLGELSGNTDTFWSVYTYKERSSDKFFISPGWDFDLAFDNDSRTYPINNNTNWICLTQGSVAGNMRQFVQRILADKDAEKEMRTIWANARKSGRICADSLKHYVDSMARFMEGSANLNFTRWPILNERIHMNPVARGSFEAEVKALSDYVTERIEWMDDLLGYGGGSIYVDSTYYISTPAELAEFAYAVNRGANGSTGYLTK